jgi:hypothetical protein
MDNIGIVEHLKPACNSLQPRPQDRPAAFTLDVAKWLTKPTDIGLLSGSDCPGKSYAPRIN